MVTLLTNYLQPHLDKPTGREEAWRFTPLARTRGLTDAVTLVLDRPSLTFEKAPPGISFSVVDASDVLPISTTDDVVVARVRNAVSKVTLIDIAKEFESEVPIYVKRLSAGLDAEFSRTVIRAGVHSKATVVIENSGSTTLGEEIEIILEAGSNLTFISLQEWAGDTVHLARHHAIIGKDATFTSHVVTVGGSLVRILPTVEYSGIGGSAELNGVYFATDGQHFEHRIHVDHNLPNGKSRVNYKGALAGNGARTVWIGDVFIQAAAEGTDTYELNRNLLLTDGARADSVPNLEIETGEIIGAGHASTTGRFDDEQLFYLESRGIPADIARRLVIRGFFFEIISKIGIEVIEERIMERIDAELTQASA